MIRGEERGLFYLSSTEYNSCKRSNLHTDALSVVLSNFEERVHLILPISSLAPTIFLLK